MSKKNKKVLYITYDGVTDQLGQSQVIPYLTILSEKGYEITLISTEKKARLEKDGETVKAILEKAGINWQPIMFSRRPPLLAKLYDQWQLNRKAAQLYKKEKFDFIHCRSYVPVAAAIKLYRRYGVPYLFDMRGFWVDERVDNGQWNLGNPFYRFLYKVYKGKERIYLDNAAHIITLTQRGKRELTDVFKVGEKKISVIPCCVDLDFFDYKKIPAKKTEKLKESLQIPNEAKILSYLGSLGGWYLTDDMLDFFKTLKAKNSNSVFLFITHDSKSGIMKRCAAKGIHEADIRVVPASRRDVPELLSLSDWGIFFIKDAYSKRGSSPTKQGEIMAMGIPVVCNDIGDTGMIIENSGAGIVIKKFETEEYERAADLFVENNNFDKEKIRQSSFTYYDLQNAGTSYAEIYHVLSQFRKQT